MSKPSEKLAQSLQVLRDLQDHGIVAIRARDLMRTHKERLQTNGFLQEVMKGCTSRYARTTCPARATSLFPGVSGRQSKRRAGACPGQVADHDQVYIKRSMHVPPNREAVRDLMPVFFECLRDETVPAVRVILGHFMFVYIHPYMDGNGRMGRLLMNVMLAAGGYPWTVIPLEKREGYMAVLEETSVNQNILPVTAFPGKLVESGL